MAATPQNVEMEAAKFLHKLIQESTDEPTKLATKLHVILQHMRSSGKENSMPYQVISRAMETVINRHSLDVEALMSSRQPGTSGTQGGESSLSQIAGSSQQIAAETDVKKSVTAEDLAKISTFSSKPMHIPSSVGHEIYQGSANQLASIKSHGSNAGTSGSYESAEPGNPRSMQFSNSYDNQSASLLMHKGPTASKTLQGGMGISNNIGEMGMLRNEASRDTGKLPAVQGPSVGPFKEHHLKQLRAQCLVFLAFRNNLMPKKLHLEIALGNVFPKEEISSLEQKGKEQSMGPGSSSSVFVSETNLLKEGEKVDRMVDKNDPPSGVPEHGNHMIPRKLEPDMQTSDSATKLGQPDPTSITQLADIRHANAHLSSFPLNERQMMVPKTAIVLEKDVMLGNSHEGEDTSELSTSQASPKYTMSEKWIADCQKRKVAADNDWAVKKKKTEQRIAVCVEKLKVTVSSSKDISAKTKSVIELKKLELLNLQRRLRNDILTDFFRPISNEIDRLKSIKKHRIGRRSKQHERHEQKMKEERQKRIRERQKDFFGEMEQHRERLEDVFKYRRERLKGFNRYAREFHKRKERLHREKIDRIQREKINLLKINDVEGYLRMVQDAKSDRVKQLLKETEKYLQKLGSKLKEAKAMSRSFETDVNGANESSEFTIEDEDETDQAKHYMESNEKYYLMAHSIKETVADQPDTLVGGKLREYQMNGLRWLLSLYNNHLNGILADEMGLGKTVQVISLLCYLMENKNDNGPFLVVVPSSVLPGWETEINFWAPSINKIVYSGPPEERRKLFKEKIIQQKFNVLLTTYEYLMNKHDRPKLSKIHWHYIIIDEGHRIKNADCKLNADLKHYHSSHRLLLTGTPLQNNLEELWALLNFLLPNIFNSSEDFSQWFNKPFESTADSSLEEALLSEEENLLIINRLHQVLRPFVLRRLKHKVENQLPEKIERLVRCEPSAYQKLLMQRVEDNLGAFGATKGRAVHNSVVELRNICNHPYISQLHNEEVHEFVPKHYLPNIIRFCGKLEMLDRLLPKLKATDHRILLFSTMTRLLDVMEDYLYWKQYKYLRLDGHTSGGDRGALIDQFNNPGSPFFIFLLSIRAGGVGVNLQAADTVIIFDTDWNPQVDLQAQARAHRIGQKKEVLVLRLETVKSVEEQVRASAEHKLGVANQSITAGFFDNNTSAEDRREYLESLLRECKKEEAAPVLHDDALNYLIARSESEIDIFEEIDKKRQEEELAVWKQVVVEQGEVTDESIPPLPSRLVTEPELKSFCEAMKAIEAPKSDVLPGVAGKRKGELGNLDTRNYGRGKRAREVRSYEEQWTEDEFEKLCQVEAPSSPNPNEECKEKDSAIVTTEPEVSIGAEGGGSSNIQQTPPSESLTVPQIMEVNPPAKRGRGRPRKNKTGIASSPIGLPVSPIPIPHSVKTAAPTVKAVAPTVKAVAPTVKTVTGSSSNLPGSGQSTVSLTSAPTAGLAAPPGFQPTTDRPPGLQPADAPPGYKPLTTPPGYQPLASPPGFQQITSPPPGFQPKFTSPPPTLSSSQTTPAVIPSSQTTPTVPASVQPQSNPAVLAPSQSTATIEQLSSPTAQVVPVSLPVISPTSPDSHSAISPVTSIRGRGEGGRGRARGRGRGRGDIVESEVDLPPQRSGKKSIVLGLPNSPIGKPEISSPFSKPEAGAAKPKSGSSVAKQDAGSLARKPKTGSSAAKPEAGRTEIGSLAGKPESGKSETGSSACKPEAGKPETGSSAGKPETGSSSGKPETGTLADKPETGSAASKPETGSPSGQPVTGSPASKPETGSSAIKPEAGKPETGSSASNPEAGKPETGSSASKPETGFSAGEAETGKPETDFPVAPSTEAGNESLVSDSTPVSAQSNTPVAMTVSTPVTVAATPSKVSASVMADVGTTQTSVSASVGSQTPMPPAITPVSSLSTTPDSTSKKGRGKGRKDQSGVDPSPQPPSTRRRERRKKDDALDTPDGKSDEPAPKRTRASSGRKTVATRSMARNQPSEIAEPVLNSSSKVKGKSSSVEDSIGTHENVVTTESGSKSHDDVEITKPNEEMDVGERESEPSKEAEFSMAETEKTEEKDHVINHGGTSESNPAEQKIVEDVQKASTVVQTEESPLEVESASSKTVEEKPVHKEKEQEANDPMTEDVVDANKTSPELAVSQVKGGGDTKPADGSVDAIQEETDDVGKNVSGAENENNAESLLETGVELAEKDEDTSHHEGESEHAKQVDNLSEDHIGNDGKDHVEPENEQPVAAPETEEKQADNLSEDKIGNDGKAHVEPENEQLIAAPETEEKQVDNLSEDKIGNDGKDHVEPENEQLIAEEKQVDNLSEGKIGNDGKDNMELENEQPVAAPETEEKQDVVDFSKSEKVEITEECENDGGVPVVAEGAAMDSDEQVKQDSKIIEEAEEKEKEETVTKTEEDVKPQVDAESRVEKDSKDKEEVGAETSISMDAEMIHESVKEQVAAAETIEASVKEQVAAADE